MIPGAMTPADYAALRAEILARPDCAPLAVTPDMPKDPTAAAKDREIADLISTGRTRVASRLIGDGEVSLALGMPAGPLFLLGLEQAATTPPAPDATAQQIEQHAIARQAWRSLEKGALDVGRADVRAAIDAMVGALLTAEQADKIKALAQVEHRISAADVSRALRGPWE